MNRIITITKLINDDILSNQTDLDWLEKRMPNVTNLLQIEIAKSEMNGYKLAIRHLNDCLELVNGIKIKTNKYKKQ